MGITRQIFARSLAKISVKKGLRGKHYACDKEGKTAMIKWLKEQSTEFYEAGIHTLIRRWNIAIERNGDYVEK